MVRQAAEMADQVAAWYASFEFHKIYQRVNQACVVDLSAFYFDVLKDRLYTYAPESPARRSAQTAIWKIGEALVRLLAPILSFTCEEVWQHLPKVANRPVSVHLATFPSEREIVGELSVPDDYEQLRSDWTMLQAIRDEVLKALESARNDKLIGGSLEAQVTLTAAEPAYSLLKRHQSELRYLFIVSQATLEKAPAGDGAAAVTVAVAKAAGSKCERCWNHSTHVGEDPVYPGVCERCSAVLKELERESRAPVA
jgi:isoleucyl-tRNA synthetase